MTGPQRRAPFLRLAVPAAEEANGNPMAAIADLLDRLQAVLVEETAVLRGVPPAQLAVHTMRKNQLMLELLRARRTCSDADIRHRHADRLAQLRAALAENRGLLETHLAATREVSSMIVTAIREADSDGTYGRPQRPSPYAS